MQRRFVRRSFGGRRRRKTKWQWVRFMYLNTAPTFPLTVDLLSDYRNQFGITLNPADTVLWRLLLNYSVEYSLSALNATSGIFFSVFNESIVSGAPNGLTQQYSERYLMWDEFYSTEQFLQSGSVTSPVAQRKFDIRSHRKLQNQDETFFAQFVLTGNATGTSSSVSMTYSMLLRLP